MKCKPLTEAQVAKARANAVEAQRDAPCLTGEFIVFLCDSHEALRASLVAAEKRATEAVWDVEREAEHRRLVHARLSNRAEKAEAALAAARREAQATREALGEIDIEAENISEQKDRFDQTDVRDTECLSVIEMDACAERIKGIVACVLATPAPPAASPAPDAVGVPRREVRAFAAAMEERLRANDHKGGWDACGVGYLLSRLREETRELTRAVGGRDGDVRREAADVANFAMMIADVCGTLATDADAVVVRDPICGADICAACEQTTCRPEEDADALVGMPPETNEQRWARLGWHVEWSDEVRAYLVCPRSAISRAEACHTYTAETVGDVDEWIAAQEETR